MQCAHAFSWLSSEPVFPYVGVVSRKRQDKQVVKALSEARFLSAWEPLSAPPDPGVTLGNAKKNSLIRPQPSKWEVSIDSFKINPRAGTDSPTKAGSR